MLGFYVCHNLIIYLSISEQNLLFLHFSRFFILAVLLFVFCFSFLFSHFFYPSYCTLSVCSRPLTFLSLSVVASSVALIVPQPLFPHNCGSLCRCNFFPWLYLLMQQRRRTEYSAETQVRAGINEVSGICERDPCYIGWIMRFPWQSFRFPDSPPTGAAADVFRDNSICYGKLFPFPSFILLHSLCLSLCPFVFHFRKASGCVVFGSPLRRIQLVSLGAGPVIVPACDQQVGLSHPIKIELPFSVCDRHFVQQHVGTSRIWHSTKEFLVRWTQTSELELWSGLRFISIIAIFLSIIMTVTVVITDTLHQSHFVLL